MPDWKPIEGDYPDEFDEEYTLDIPGRWGEEIWEFRRVGDDSYLRVEGIEPILKLPGLKSFSGLFPDAEIPMGTTDSVAAKWPQIYVLQSRSATRGPLGLENVTAGPYRICWFDLENTRWASEDVQLDGGDEWIDAPEDVGDHIVAFILRRGR